MYLTIPGFTGGYDDMEWTFYVWVDSYGDYVVEPGSDYNNVMALPTITNTNPLGESELEYLSRRKWGGSLLAHKHYCSKLGAWIWNNCIY